MERLRTRNEIMEWLEEYAPYPCIRRAVVEGTTELLGVFRNIQPSGTMGWIVEVTSKHNRTWHVAIQPNDFKHSFYCHVISELSWEKWMGDISNGDLYEGGVEISIPLYVGDNPSKYNKLKCKELEDAKERRLNQAD